MAALNEPRRASLVVQPPVPKGQLCKALGMAAAKREVDMPSLGTRSKRTCHSVASQHL